MQTQRTVESFGWQWTKQTVVDSKKTFHRRLFKDCGIWCDYLNGKVIADICSGNGRHVWALNELANAKKIISVELAKDAADYQSEKFSSNQKIEVIQGDAKEVEFKADFIYMLGAIQHVSDAEAALQNIVKNMNDRGELVISFYMVTIATTLLEPIRFILKRLPKRILWLISPLLAPIFVINRNGLEMGFKNARHTAYDWFWSHEYQRYFTESEILTLFEEAGINETNIIRLQKGLYKVRKGEGANVDDVIHSFGAE
ncbi:MAG: class I SAM-dependent methyltransferase [Gammaproteobacteria bacterium]|nr:class I SAM-dependent methyltransferase [Gammaproteobacteria bacterium]